MKFIDLFAGIGGIRVAFEKQGNVCVFSSENNKHAQMMYKENFGEMPEGDITQIKSEDIPKHDMILAGFPCQPFSISGKKLGYEDTRGTLFFEILRIAEYHNTEVIVLENVKNLMHHDDGRTYEVIEKSLQGLGYHVSKELLNAKDFGIPQNRERIIIVATKNKKIELKKPKEIKETTLESILEKKEHEYLKEEEYTLLNKDQIKKQKSGLIFAGYLNKNMRKKGVREGTEHLSRVHKQPNRIYDAKGTHPTLNSQEKAGRYYIKDDVGVRKITIEEAKRLMGFPKDYKLIGTEGQIRERLGNSVVVPMLEYVAKEIKKEYEN